MGGKQPRLWRREVTKLKLLTERPLFETASRGGRKRHGHGWLSIALGTTDLRIILGSVEIPTCGALALIGLVD
jgi:hypothetical protein